MISWRLREWPLALVFAAVWYIAATPATSFAQSLAAPAPALPPLLDVPYLAQPPELCGGAAVAMVLRYWGARDVFPEDYRALIDAKAKGISTDALLAAVRSTKWTALETRDDASVALTNVRRSLTLGRPVIALIEVRRDTYHYVVITGLTADRVVLHDPAVAPYRVLALDDFARAWASTSQWAMVIVPSAPATQAPAAATPRTSTPATVAPTNVCDGLVEQSVGLAADDREAAERGLLAAAALCPSSAGPWRELAGLRFLESRWTDAQAFAVVATSRDPHDEYAWRLLASSRFIGGDTVGALAAWNRVGELHTDTVNVQGVTRTRVPVVVTRIGLTPRTLLTPDAFLRAGRRLSELPAASVTHLRYEPIEDGRARLDAVVSERDRLPYRPVALAEMGIRAAVTSELRVDVTSLLDAGDLWRTEWRWVERRPRLGVTMSLPDVQPVHGIASVQFIGEHQTYRADPDGPDSANITESRRRVTFGVGDWLTSQLRWQVDGGLDRLADRDHAVVQSALDWRSAGDRVAIGLSGGRWFSSAESPAFSRASVSAAWRSTVRMSEPSVMVSGGIATTTDNAPLALWAGAGTGQGRDFLLRAHPLLSSDVIVGPAFGRTLAHVTGEYARPIVIIPTGSLSVAVFADAGKAWRRLLETASPLLVDVGAGFRMRAPGLSGSVRLDLAYGVNSGGAVLSAGWGLVWPQ